MEDQHGDIADEGDAFSTSADQSYRTCPVCGADCVPEASGADGLGARIAFVCPEHGVHSVIDPFEEDR